MAAGRIWYEADLNYYEGRRNGHRLLFSNDGLFFVTYDHYKTFYELMGEGEYAGRKALVWQMGQGMDFI